MTATPQAPVLPVPDPAPVEDAPASGQAIELEALSKEFHDPRRGTFRAVDEISFDCRYGEVVGLLGPNGAGKTTTLRMLSTVLTPTSGKARVAGCCVENEALDVRQRIGYLSANTNLYLRLTPRETLEYFGSLHGLRGEELHDRVEELLTSFDMHEFSDVRCEKLSTGMRQKVSIARTVVHDPPVLILDEPTLGLDILVASTMIRFIEEIRARGKCILFSTHIMGEVEKLCDRVAVIHRGRLLALGGLDDLREQTGEQYLEDIFFSLIREGRKEES